MTPSTPTNLGWIGNNHGFTTSAFQGIKKMACIIMRSPTVPLSTSGWVWWWKSDPPERRPRDFVSCEDFFFGTRRYIVFKCFSDPPFFLLWFEMGSPGTSRTLMSRIVTSSRNGVTWPTWRLDVGDSEMLDGFEWCFHTSPCQIHERSTNGSTPKYPPKKECNSGNSRFRFPVRSPFFEEKLELPDLHNENNKVKHNFKSTIMKIRLTTV